MSLPDNIPVILFATYLLEILFTSVFVFLLTIPVILFSVQAIYFLVVLYSSLYSLHKFSSSHC